VSKLPDGISPTGHTVATIKYFQCERCGLRNEIRLKDVVPAHLYNAVADYCRKAAGDEFVLLPVATLNAMGEERYKAVERVMQLDLLRHVFEERDELKRRVRELESGRTLPS
jgi:hypothetical protein